MRREHFEALSPICPVCRRQGTMAKLGLSLVTKEAGGHVVEGILGCPQPACLREYPILDGLPLLVTDLRTTVTSQLEDLVMRQDLSPQLESLVGDCCGPSSAFESRRQRLSTYGRDHWGDADGEDKGQPPPGSIVSLVERALELAGEPVAGPVLDVGCGPGRSTFELAERLQRPALGVDLSAALLQIAAGVLREGEARYPRRRVGLAYDRRQVAARPSFAEAVDFWLADAIDLPFGVGFSMVVALNLVDCVTSPRDTLASLAACLAAGGLLVVATPYDWTPSATPVEGWLGGHSQRGADGGRSEPVLRALVAGGHPAGVPGLEIVAEDESVTWKLRLHDRATMEYRAHLLVARAAPAGP